MKKTICKIMVVMMLIAIFYPIKSQAGLQGNKNGTSLTTATSEIDANKLFTGIRAMETGTIGKVEQDAQDGIDCHMAKNTEWGTAAMLSASKYGKAPNGVSDETTTGNESGVCQMADGTGADKNAKGYELVAGILQEYSEYEKGYMGTIAKADPKYYDLYTKTEIKSKAGDATLETQGWKGATIHNFITDRAVFARSWKGLFGYHQHAGTGNGNWSYSFENRMCWLARCCSVRKKLIRDM